MSLVPYTIVDSPEGVSAALGSFQVLSLSDKPILYVDLEGINLCRHGSISVIQMYQSQENRVYLIDVHSLGAAAFSTASKDGSTTLKRVLESSSILKGFFDVRNDSDALYNHFGVYLRGVVDIQLMELRTRTGSRKFVNGLARRLEQYFAAAGSFGEAATWRSAKQAGLRLFAPERGGSYEVFNARPMPQAILDYCIQDVTFLPKLYDLYAEGISFAWQGKLDRAAAMRVSVCQQRNYLPNGREKAVAPAFI